MHYRAPPYAGVILGAIAGVTTAVLGSLLASDPVKLAVLPAGIALFLFMLLDRKTMLLAILVFRSAGDVFFEATKLSLGGYQIGVGGLINAFVILIVVLLVIEKPNVLPKRMTAMWAGFLLAALIGIALSPVRADAIRSFLSILSYFAVFVGAFYVVRSPADFRVCVRVVLWSSVIPAIYALVEIATEGPQGVGAYRIHGTFAHPNIFAFHLTLVISLILYMLKTSRATLPGEARLGLNLYMLVLLGLLALTQTRSAWVACFVVFAVYGLFFERRYLVYIILAPLLALLIPGVQDRLLDLGAGNEYVQYARLNSFAWRRLIWETSLQWMRPDHYFLGYGLSSFTHYSPLFFPLAGNTNPGAHNVYVQLLFEVGLAGLMTYLWLYGRLLWLMKAMIPLDRLGAFISIILIVAYLIISLSDNMLAYLSFNWYFWFLVGASTAVVMLDENRRSSGQPSQRAPASRPGVTQAT